MVPDGPVRVVDFLPRTVFRVVGILLATAIVLEVVWIARHVLTWIFIALFLAVALNPAVDRLERRIKRRGIATGVIYLIALGAAVGVGFLFIPTLVHQVNDFAGKVPDYLNDLTKGRGRLGFLETKYHLVDKAREALNSGGASKLFGVSGTALALAKGVVNVVLATVTITFMTFFMLLEGPRWVESFFTLLEPEARAALAGGRTRHLPHGRRLCDGQPSDQSDRRDAHDDRPASHRRSVCPGARADRRDSRPDPTGRRDARGHHRRLGGVPPLDSGRDHRRSCSSSCTSSSRTTSSSRSFTGGPCSSRHSWCSSPC